MMSNRDNNDKHHDQGAPSLSRRSFMQAGAVTAAAAVFPGELLAILAEPDNIVDADKRFPYFQSTPVSYFNVKMQDSFWAPRQKVVRDVTVSWATRHWDAAGGLDTFTAHPETYKSMIRPGDLEAIKFIEAMAAVVGVQRDRAIEGLAEAWGKKLIDGQQPDGYSLFGWPLASDPTWRWKAVWYSHEDYALGHYLESAIGYNESTANAAMYNSAVRAVDNMASVFLGSSRAYAPGHEEIEHALMRLYGLTGDTKYLRLCGWLIGQRGHHEGRPSYGRYSQDHVPITEQRTIEGHAVRAAFLFNGVTEYVGATGDAGYREAVLAIWDNFVDHKMYLHGAGGNESAKNEGYSPKPDFIPPNDCYGESCSVFGNFQWAHSLFRLTGDAAYLDVAERMLYNAFYASLSLKGDRHFYQNVLVQEKPTLRFEWHPVPCCPPNIVKLLSKVGGFFYSTDKDGIFIKHYGASEADVPFRHGVKLVQRTTYPWTGDITVKVEPAAPLEFTLRLRVPAWAKSYTVSVNGDAVTAASNKGWAVVRRKWKAGDRVDLSLPMNIERVTMPARFKEYADLVAIQRGPIVYCLEEQDVAGSFFELYLPEGTRFAAENRSDFLGGVTVVRASLPRVNFMNGSETHVAAMFVPYGVWNNRDPGAMTVWLADRKRDISQLLPSENPPGEF